MSKKRPTKKPKPTPRVYINVRYSFPLGMRLTKAMAKDVAEQVDGCVADASALYRMKFNEPFPFVTIDVGEDLEGIDVTYEGVEVRR